jgi:hypothetical protein
MHPSRKPIALNKAVHQLSGNIDKMLFPRIIPVRMIKMTFSRVEKIAVPRPRVKGLVTYLHRAAALLHVFYAPNVRKRAADQIAFVRKGCAAKLKFYKIAGLAFLIYSVKLLVHACFPHLFACFAYCYTDIIAV